MVESQYSSQGDVGTSDELTHLDEKETGLISFNGLVEGGSDLGNDTFPTSDQEAKIAEDILADEIAKLSLVEHERIMFDVHGIAQHDQQDPEDLDALLHQVEIALGTIRNKRAYDRAQYLDEEYVNGRSFRLMFLRCDRFDSVLAAQRIVRHFEVKQTLFGEGMLTRDIRLSDLSASDILALESGFIQVLPSRDVAGRPIFSVAPMYRPNSCSADTCARVMWYIFSTTMKDEEAQRKGIVGIMWNFGVNAMREPISLVAHLHKIRSGIPKKIVGFHYCFNDAALKPFITGLQMFLSKEIRTRFRSHFGDRDMIEFELQTFGIPTNEHPLLQNGALSLEWHRQWLDVRRTQEESENSRDGAILPRRFDVLFGRGKNNREHTGNLRAAHLVEMHQIEYEKAGKMEKTEIAERIVNIIHESYGRFLKWEKEGWIEVDHEAAREKISHFFRHLRSTRKVPSSDPTTADATKSDSTAAVYYKRVTPCQSPIHDPDASCGKSARRHDRDGSDTTANEDTL